MNSWYNPHTGSGFLPHPDEHDHDTHEKWAHHLKALSEVAILGNVIAYGAQLGHSNEEVKRHAKAYQGHFGAAAGILALLQYLVERRKD
ncbi:hypothetical protein M8Z33_26835 [Streptomyces sp. ZAF1911]|uniref:hypothetical protein n=1 Tax=Streptomyces sp. ZAF1911 TaxID=2944129 RepID=UPI00237C1570|nr:hypothetical protein [Streptomyces sp. ZAF1911]MDD9380204.1 hypothetical protein [Streptomyces sp. ZAF1911]